MLTLGDPHATRQWNTLLHQIQEEFSIVRQCDKEARGMRMDAGVSRSNSYQDVSTWRNILHLMHETIPAAIALECMQESTPDICTELSTVTHLYM